MNNNNDPRIDLMFFVNCSNCRSDVIFESIRNSKCQVFLEPSSMPTYHHLDHLPRMHIFEARRTANKAGERNQHLT